MATWPTRSWHASGKADRRMAAQVQVVMFVMNDARHDSRVLREATALRAEGYRVTIMARTSQPYAAQGSRERRPDGIEIIRVPVAGGVLRWLLLARRPRLAAHEARAWVRARFADPPVGWLRLLVVAAAGVIAAPVVALAALALGLGDTLVRRIGPLRAAWRAVGWRLQWRYAVQPWTRAAAAAAPAGDILHAHDLQALPAAIARRGPSSVPVVYDSHEIFVEAGLNASRPAWARRDLRALERRSAATIDALVTVNDELAAVLGPALDARARDRRAQLPAALDDPCAAARPPAPGAGPAGATAVVLYHGAFVAGRGLAELAAAMRQPGLEAAHLVYLGWGASQPEVAALAADPAAGGRLHLLPGVPPDELLPWVASADVVALPIQPDTLNHRLSTPNKLWEALAAGVPVVACDFPALRQIVLGDPAGPLGAVCDPIDPVAIGTALGGLLALPAAERAALRSRCLRAAHERWNWETEFATLLALYRELTGRPSRAPALPGVTPQRVTYLVPGTGVFDSRTKRLGASMAARGHRVRIIGRASPNVPDEETLTGGVEVVRVAVGAASPRATAARGRLRRLAGEAARVGWVWRTTAAQARAARAVDDGADVYHAMGFLGLPVGLRLAGRSGRPLVYDARDIYAESNNLARMPRLVRALFRLRERRWAHRVSRVFTVQRGPRQLPRARALPFLDRP